MKRRNSQSPNKDDELLTDHLITLFWNHHFAHSNPNLFVRDVRQKLKNQVIPTADARKLCDNVFERFCIFPLPNEECINQLIHVVLSNDMKKEDFVDSVINISEMPNEYLLPLIDKLKGLFALISPPFGDTDGLNIYIDCIFKLITWYFSIYKKHLGDEIDDAVVDSLLIMFESRYHRLLYHYNTIHSEERRQLFATISATMGDKSPKISSLIDEQIMKFPLNLPDYSVIEVPKTYTAIIYGMVSVYSTLKTITPIDEMAEVFDVVGGNFLLSKPQLLEKIMKATILCKLDYDTGTRKMHLQAFNFLKIPKLFLYMFETLKSITKEDIIEAIDNICKEVFMLNSIDAKMNENIIKIMCQEFVKIGLMSQESLQKYIDIRKKDYLKEKGVLLALVDSEDLTIPPVINSDQIKQLIGNLSESNNNTALPILTSLIEGGGEIFDALCASYLTEEQIYEFSYKLIMLNVLNEPFLGGDDEDKKMRSSIFDITFLCLTRLRYFHKDLRLVKLVGISKNEDLEKSTFYKWNNNYVNHEYERISIDSASTPTADPVKLNTLQCGKPFWTITDHYGEMIEKIPDIGYTLWKEFSNPKVNEKEMRICLISFHQMPCFFVCLIHWLDTQNLAPAKKLFVKIIKSILPGNEITDPEARERWMFAVSAIKRVLEDMIKETQPRPYIGHMNITTTENFLPMPSHNEIPDVVLFRISFQQSSRRGFLNPNAAEIINQRMITNGIEDWCALGIDEIFNGQTMDDALASIETMIVSAFCNLTVCLAELARNLVDYMLRPDIYCMSIAQPYSMCLARLLHRVMAILIWANEYRLRKTPLEDDAFGVDPIMRTFDIILKRFYKETLTGHLKPTVSFIVGFLYEVAIAPTTEQHLKLIKLFEKNLFFNIVKLEPTQASFEVFLKIFGMDEDPKYGIVQYATLLQRRNGFELPINFLTAPPVTEKSEQTLGEEEMEFSNKSVQDEHHFEIEQ